MVYLAHQRQMFKMNPAAKEFVPAHILKKRQEDAERLGELTEKLDKVDINKPDNSGLENGGEKPSGGSEESQESSSTQHSNPRPVLNNRNSTSPNNVSNRDSTSEAQNGKHLNNNHTDGDYPEGLQDLIDEEDDRFLLNAGENICEFNGEQFIIPGE